VLAIAGATYGCLSAVFRAWREWLVPVLAVECAGALLQLAGSVWVVHRGGRVDALLWLAASIQVLQVVAAAVLWRATRAWHDSLERPTFGSAMALLRRSAPFALAGVIANAHERVAPIALGYLATTEQVALFGASSRLAGLVKMAAQSAFAGALPVLAAEVARGAASRIRAQFHTALRAFTLVAAVFLATFSGLLLRATYGTAFVAAAPALVWMAGGLVPTLINSGRKISLYAAGRERTATTWSAVALAIQGAGCLMLVPRFGASGAAMAILAGEISIWWMLRRGEVAVQSVELFGGPVRIVSERPLTGR
jgi:O-antigen/teichoic acid export membrane protein